MVVVLVVVRVTFFSGSVAYWRVLFGVEGHQWRRDDYQALVFAKAIGYATVESTILQEDAYVSFVGHQRNVERSLPRPICKAENAGNRAKKHYPRLQHLTFMPVSSIGLLHIPMVKQ